MPSYRVKSKGFHNGTLCIPGHPIKGILETDAPLKPVPSWLEPIKGENATSRKARQAEAKRMAEEAKKKKEMDDREIQTVSFVESPKVEVL